MRGNVASAVVFVRVCKKTPDVVCLRINRKIDRLRVYKKSHYQ